MNLGFLKNIGKLIATGAEIALGIGPIIEPFLGSKAAAAVTKGINDFTAIGQVVAMMEVALQGDGRGADKLQASLPAVENIIRTSELVSGRKIDNEQGFVDGCKQVVSGLVAVLNSLHPKVDTVSDRLPAPTPSPAPVKS
jgi:hypothetical protein